MRSVISLSHFVSVGPSSSGGRLLTLFPTRAGSFPWESVCQERLQSESFPQATVPSWTAQTGAPSIGFSPSGTHCSCSPVGSQVLPASCFSMDSLFCVTTGLARILLQHCLPTRPQLVLSIHLLQHRDPPGLQVDLHGFQVDSLPHHGLHCHWQALPWPAVGPSQTQLALTLLDMGKAPGSLSQKAPRCPPCNQNLATQTHYKPIILGCIRGCFWMPIHSVRIYRYIYRRNKMPGWFQIWNVWRRKTSVTVLT